MHLHVIVPEVPYPAKSGASIDVYHRLQALANNGIKLHLHAFAEGSDEITPELYRLCVEVHLYQRKSRRMSLSQRFPQAVNLRVHPDLLHRLLLDDVPILFEGLSSTYYLSHPEFERRVKVVRLPRVEWQHVQMQVDYERNYLKRQALLGEAKRWELFEQTLSYADHLLPMSAKDCAYYADRHPKVSYLPPFHGHNKVSSQSGKGEYYVYHGDLGMIENHVAAMFLVEQVFADLKLPFFVAGRNPQADLIAAVSRHSRITLKPFPGEGELADLLHHAHGHVLPSFFAGGVPLKLINSLFMGRFVIVNPLMVEGSDLAFGTHVARNPEEMKRVVFDLSFQEFTEIDIAQRKAALNGQFKDHKNADRLVDAIRLG